MSYTLKKYESLKKKKYFDAIFCDGNSVKVFPIRAIYIAFNSNKFVDIEIPNNSQVAFSVPKKRFKLAVNRNRIKRQMREAYRLNKNLLTDKYAIIFVYLPNTKMDYHTIETSMKNILNAINEKSENDLK